MIFGGEIFAPDLYKGSLLTEAILFIVGGVVLEALDIIVFHLLEYIDNLKNLMALKIMKYKNQQSQRRNSIWTGRANKGTANMKKLLLTAYLLMLATHASAWVSKSFIPANVSLVSVNIKDRASDCCWNIGEVKRYPEDKLKLAGFKVSIEKFQWYENDSHYILSIMVNSSRNVSTYFGNIEFGLAKFIKSNNMEGMYLVGQYGSNFTGTENANQYTLKLMGGFMEEVESLNGNNKRRHIAEG